MNVNEKEKLKERLLFSEGDLHVYVGITKKEFPELYEEIREISEREFSIENAYDRFDETYKYLVCIAEYERPWELPLEKVYEIVSFYRYISCKDAFSQEGNNFDLSTNKFYDYSLRFKIILPATLELGRSVVNHDSQYAKSGLEIIWKGLGALIDYYSKHENINFLFGEVSIQKNQYHIEDLWENDSLESIISCFILNFNRESLIIPKEKLIFSKAELLQFAEEKGFEGNFSKDSGKLRRLLKSRNHKAPQLFFHYANLVEKDGLEMYLPVDNKLLNCWEMGLLLKIDCIKPHSLRHFMPSFYREEAFI